MASLGKGTGLIALLTGAVMFALGLFFGWLLHRERVERALYEDAVRARDRANTTLAETAARLELANKDMIRLREQLTAAQHGLEARDETIAELEAERSLSDDADADGSDAADGLRDMPEASVDTGSRRPTRARSTAPAGAQLFDQLELDGEVDITEEVALPPVSDHSDDVGDATTDGAEPDAEPDRDATEAVSVGDGSPDAESEGDGGADGEPVGDGSAAAEAEPGDDGAPDAQPVGDGGGAAEAEPCGDGAPDAQPVGDGGANGEPVGDDGGPDAGPGDDVGAAPVTGMGSATGEHIASATATAVEPLRASAGDPVPTSGIGDTLVVEPTDSEEPAAPTSHEQPHDVPDDLSTADIPGTAQVTPADDLRRISGVGPALERMLHAQGITTFRQLASLDDDAIADLRSRSPRLATRLRRGAWVSQARRLHMDTHGDEP